LFFFSAELLSLRHSNRGRSIYNYRLHVIQKPQVHIGDNCWGNEL